MQTTAGEIMRDLQRTLPGANTLGIVRSDDGKTLWLEYQGYMLVVNDYRGENRTHDPRGYDWFTFHVTPEDVWIEGASGYARDEESVRSIITRWWDKLSSVTI